MTSLEQSIEIWKERAAITELAEYPVDACPLCSEFPSCIGCPVFIKTGASNCHLTPYWDVFEARRKRDINAVTHHAQRMVNLLESCQ